MDFTPVKISITKSPFDGTVITVKTALYLRVSTKPRKTIKPERQLREQTEENQRFKLHGFANAMEWSIAAEFVDRESGAKKNRPGFKAMMDAASRHEFDVILVWSLDRFTREGIGPTLQHLAKLAGYRVAFRSYSEPFLDTTSQFGDLVTSIFAFFAAFERKRIGERVLAAHDRARAEGKHIGRPHAAPDPRLLAKVKALREEGKSIRQLANELELTHGTAQRLVFHLSAML